MSSLKSGLQSLYRIVNVKGAVVVKSLGMLT